MNINIEITTISTAIIAIATVSYAIFSGITIKKLNKQNELLIAERHSKLALFYRKEWEKAGFNKIIKKLKNYPAYSFIKSLPLDEKINKLSIEHEELYPEMYDRR